MSNNYRQEGLRPTCMTQDEANEVVELWAQIQREEANRQALVTVHDVAEAIQVSPDQVERLLETVRHRKPRGGRKVRQAGTGLHQTISRRVVLAQSALLSSAVGYIYLITGTTSPIIGICGTICLTWTLVIGLLFFGNWIVRRIEDYGVKTAERRRWNRVNENC